MNWGMEDIIVAAILIACLIGGVFLAWRVLKRPLLRLCATTIVCLIIALIWAELAVGIL